MTVLWIKGITLWEREKSSEGHSDMIQYEFEQFCFHLLKCSLFVSSCSHLVVCAIPVVIFVISFALPPLSHLLGHCVRQKVVAFSSQKI